MTALSDRRRRLHDRRSADDRLGRLRSPVTNSGGGKSQCAEANRRVGTTVAVANLSQGTPENCLPSSIRRHANRTVVDRSRRNRSSADPDVDHPSGCGRCTPVRSSSACQSPPAGEDFRESGHRRRPFRVRHRHQNRLQTVIDAVREPCPPRSPLTMNCSTTRRPPGYALNGSCPPAAVVGPSPAVRLGNS